MSILEQLSAAALQGQANLSSPSSIDVEATTGERLQFSDWFKRNTLREEWRFWTFRDALHVQSPLTCEPWMSPLPHVAFTMATLSRLPGSTIFALLLFYID